MCLGMHVCMYVCMWVWGVGVSVGVCVGVSACPAMRFVVLRGMELKFGNSVGDGSNPEVLGSIPAKVSHVLCKYYIPIKCVPWTFT